MTPVFASGPPSSRARMRSRRGPIELRSTPMISTLKSSSLSPANTVFPTAIIPGRNSSTGKSLDCAGRPAPIKTSRAPRTASVRLYIGGCGGTAYAEDTVNGAKLQERQRFTVDSRAMRALLSKLRHTPCHVRLAPLLLDPTPATGGGTGLQLKGRLPACNTRPERKDQRLFSQTVEE